MFKISKICLLNKIDVENAYFEKEEFLSGLKGVNPDIVIFEISSKRGDNFELWIQHLERIIISFK